MAFSEICLNFTQIICIEPGLWFGFSSYSFFLDSPTAYVFVTLNQILFLFRYYLCVFIVLHRAVIIITPRWNPFVERHVSSFIAVCWIYVIFINTAYFFFGCIRNYDAANHSWKTICQDDSRWELILLKSVSSYAFTYIPHFTVFVNFLIIAYIRYYRLTRNGHVYVETRKSSGAHYEFHMVLQPLMLACVLAVEPICFFLASVANKVVPIPPLPVDVSRIFDYAMTYLSTLTNFVFYFLCHRDIRQLILQIIRKSSGKVVAPKKVSKNTTDTIAKVA